MATAQTEPRTTIATWVPRSLAAELQARANEADRSLSAEIRRALVRHLQIDSAPESEIR